MRRRMLMASLVVVALVGAGCASMIILGAAAGAGSGALVWYRGWLEQTIGEPLDRVHRAGRSALADLKVALVEDELEGTTGLLDGYDEGSKRIVVKMKAMDDKATRVRIRVGFWGDQHRSLRILEQLKKHL